MSAEEVTPERVAELVETGEAQAVDVRTETEHAAGRLAGAVHIPFEELPSRADELERSRPVIFYCQSGNRSAAAAEAFVTSGWEAQSMAGGLTEWVDRGLPLEPEDGHVVTMSGLPEDPAAA